MALVKGMDAAAMPGVSFLSSEARKQDRGWMQGVDAYNNPYPATHLGRDCNCQRRKKGNV